MHQNLESVRARALEAPGQLTSFEREYLIYLSQRAPWGGTAVCLGATAPDILYCLMAAECTVNIFCFAPQATALASADLRRICFLDADGGEIAVAWSGEIPLDLVIIDGRRAWHEVEWDSQLCPFVRAGGAVAFVGCDRPGTGAVAGAVRDQLGSGWAEQAAKGSVRTLWHLPSADRTCVDNWAA
jgi:hypothetical protein